MTVPDGRPASCPRTGCTCAPSLDLQQGCRLEVVLAAEGIKHANSLSTRPFLIFGRHPPQRSDCSKYTTPLADCPTLRNVPSRAGERKFLCRGKGCTLMFPPIRTWKSSSATRSKCSRCWMTPILCSQLTGRGQQLFDERRSRCNCCHLRMCSTRSVHQSTLA